jgi:hypothetical protein
LNYRPVSHWITERDAKFDQGCASSIEFQDQLKRCLEIGIAGGDERNETFPIFLLKSVERVTYSAQG